jgi:hypothetical protein
VTSAAGNRRLVTSPAALIKAKNFRFQGAVLSRVWPVLSCSAFSSFQERRRATEDRLPITGRLASWDLVLAVYARMVAPLRRFVGTPSGDECVRLGRGVEEQRPPVPATAVLRGPLLDPLPSPPAPHVNRELCAAWTDAYGPLADCAVDGLPQHELRGHTREQFRVGISHKGWSEYGEVIACGQRRARNVTGDVTSNDDDVRRAQSV